MAEIAMWIGAGLSIYAGIEILRKGLSITGEQAITGTTAKAFGVVLIVGGLAVGIASSVYLRFFS